MFTYRNLQGMKWVFILAISALCFHSQGQVLKPLGSGIPGKVIAAFATDLDYLALYEESKDNYAVAHWNGIYWTHYSGLKKPNVSGLASLGYNFTSVALYKNKIYVGGFLNSLDPADNVITHLLHWNGTGWQPVSGAVETRHYGISAMTVFNDKLICAGLFSVNLSGNAVNNIVSFDGTKWNFMGKNNSEQGTNGFIHTLLVNGNRLYIGGNFKYFAGSYTGNIAFYTDANGGWGGIGSPFNGAISQLAFFDHDKKLAAIGTHNGLKQVRYMAKRDSWSQALSFSGFSKSEPLSIAGTDAYLILGGTFESNNNATSLLRFENGQLYFTGNRIQPTEITLSQTESRAYVWGLFTENSSNIKNFGHIETESGNVSGFVFNDLNNNCLQDMSEPGLSNQLVQFISDNGTIFSEFTDRNGFYTHTLVAGTYTLRVGLGKHWENLCQSGNGINVRKGIYSTIHLGIKKPLDVKDVELKINTLGAPFVEAGKSFKLLLSAQNLGSTVITGSTIHFIHDERLKSFIAFPPAENYNNNEAIFTLVNLTPGETKYFEIILSAPADAKESDKYLNSVKAGTLLNSGDVDSKDNIDTLPLKVWGGGEIPMVYKWSKLGDRQDIRDNSLFYQINFTNRCEKTAKRVVLVDTFANEELISGGAKLNSSLGHTKTYLAAQNIMVIEFDNANLAPHENNPTASGGFYEFKLNYKNNLPENITIPNRAFVSFDNSCEAVSNLVTIKTYDRLANSLVFKNLKSGVKLFPVPASDLITVQFDKLYKGQICVFDAHGKCLQSLKVNSNKCVLNISYLPAGNYYFSSELGTQQFSILH